MISILSATEHDFYAMPLPLVVWSWKQIGVNCKVFIPADYGPKLQLAMTYCEPDTDFHTFTCDKEKEATYAQVSRLFGATLEETHRLRNEMIITGDSDLAVFNREYFESLDKDKINVVGSDLLDDSMKQYPMCFIAAPVVLWYEMHGGHNAKYQMLLDKHVGSLQSENFRGDFWSLDQWLAYKWITESNHPVIHHPRAALPNHWATRRADRDGWHFNPVEIIDAHLPRPFTDQSNWDKTIKLFNDVYPDADISWMDDYRNKYLSL